MAFAFKLYLGNLLDQNDDIWRRLKFHSLVRAFPQLYTKGECVMEPILRNENRLKQKEAYST
jgi:glutaredoxin-related protein